MKVESIKSIGIMGGTFDPIHYGHLLIAEEARAKLDLDEVVFVPAGQPAHKTDCAVIDREHRYEMTLLATASNPSFFCSRIELDRSGPSYAIDTVRAFRMKYPQAEVYFITGIDAIAEILTWHEHRKLIDMCRFVAATRPGYRTEDLFGVLPPEYMDRIDILDVPGVDISGTEIRRRVAAGQSVRYLVPSDVETYIRKHYLYCGGHLCPEL